jgi:hypothetical protein
MRRREFCLGLLPAVAAVVARGQNVVAGEDGPVRERRVLDEGELAALLDVEPKPVQPWPGAAALPEQKKLEAAVAELIDGWPWRPFFHQLGISGAETHFDHPDELFANVAPAIPLVSAALAGKLRSFLRERLEKEPPFAVEGYDRAVGQAREHFHVPEALRAKGRRRAKDAWGVHGLWQYHLATGDVEGIRAHWPRVV